MWTFIAGFGVAAVLAAGTAALYSVSDLTVIELDAPAGAVHVAHDEPKSETGAGYGQAPKRGAARKEEAAGS